MSRVKKSINLWVKTSCKIVKTLQSNIRFFIRHAQVYEESISSRMGKSVDMKET